MMIGALATIFCIAHVCFSSRESEQPTGQLVNLHSINSAPPKASRFIKLEKNIDQWSDRIKIAVESRLKRIKYNLGKIDRRLITVSIIVAISAIVTSVVLCNSDVFYSLFEDRSVPTIGMPLSASDLNDEMTMVQLIEECLKGLGRALAIAFTAIGVIFAYPVYRLYSNRWHVTSKNAFFAAAFELLLLPFMLLLAVPLLIIFSIFYHVTLLIFWLQRPKIDTQNAVISFLDIIFEFSMTLFYGTLEATDFYVYSNAECSYDGCKAFVRNLVRSKASFTNF